MIDVDSKIGWQDAITDEEQEIKFFPFFSSAFKERKKN